MNNEQLSWPYWSVDLSGLTEINAQRLLAWAESEGVTLKGNVVDPARSLSVHIDDATVEALKTALELALPSKAMPSEQIEIVRGVIDLLSDWLSGRADATNHGDAS
jgi:hypothetical protein